MGTNGFRCVICKIRIEGSTEDISTDEFNVIVNEHKYRNPQHRVYFSNE